MGRVRAERISLRDERSHSEGISLASRNDGQQRSAAALTTTRLLPSEKSRRDRNEDPLLGGAEKRRSRAPGYSSYLIESRGPSRSYQSERETLSISNNRSPKIAARRRQSKRARRPHLDRRES